MKRKSKSLFAKLALSTFPMFLSIGALIATGCYPQNAGSQPNATVQPPPTKPPEKARQDLQQQIPLNTNAMGEMLPKNLFIELSKLINPTVVSISTSANPRMDRAGRARDPLQEFLEDFWGGRGPGMRPPQPSQRSQPVQALGTGFIIREDGLIITNNHVIAEADVIKVQLDNTSDKFYEAEVVGRDTLTDIALIRIDAKRPLPYARLGDSKAVQVGEWVAAFGNPYGHAHTMTKGIVSAIGREIAELNRFPFIQTDASINPGNSGGPLVNAQGLVIGVNTAIDARAQGIGFAIPIDNVKQVVAALERDGRVKRGFIGVNIATLDDATAAQLGLQEATGALVAQVVPDAPADKAGIQPYDLIVEVNGKKIGNPSELMNVVAGVDIGANAKVKVWRFDESGRKRELNLNLKVAESPDERKQAKAGRNDQKQYFGQKAPFDLGFKVADWSAPLAREHELPPEPKKPIITEVDRQSPAAAAGFRPGDMIMDVNRQAVNRAADVLKLLKKGRNIVRLNRGGQMIVITTIGS